MFVMIMLVLMVLVVSKPPELESMELFAMIGADACSEDLYYGPESVQGSDGVYRNFLSTSTKYKDVRSQNWVQIVTSDGDYELFRIYWTFDTIKTMAEHIADAVSVGEAVSYKVVTNLNKVFEYRGVWWFSSSSGVTVNTFSTPATKCCFSRTNGLWGADSGTIDAADGSQRNDDTFWGQGNFRSDDSSQCRYVYMLGTAYTSTQTSPVSYLYHSTVATPTPSPTAIPTSAPSTARPTAQPSPSSQPSLAVRTYDLVSFRVTLRVEGLSAVDYWAKPSAHNNLFGKVLSACIKGISEHDVSTYSVTATATVSTTIASTMGASAGMDADVAVLHSLVRVDTLLPPSALSQQASAALVTLSVRKEDSAYTFEQLVAQIAQSESTGALNTWLHNYAVYLNMDDLSTATASVYSTQIIEEDGGSTAEKENTTWMTPTVAAAAVLAVLLVAGCCWRKGWSCQRSDQVDVGSTHSAAALDCSSEGHVTPRSELVTGRESRTWLDRGVGTSGIRREVHTVSDVEMQYAASPPRATTSPATHPTAAVGSSRGHRAAGRNTNRHLHSQSSPMLPRGAPVVLFSPPPSAPPSSHSSAGSVVEITPRNVQVMQGFNASMRNGLPVVRAHAIETPYMHHTTATTTTAIAAVAVPAERMVDGNYIVAEAEVAP